MTAKRSIPQSTYSKTSRRQLADGASLQDHLTDSIMTGFDSRSGRFKGRENSPIPCKLSQPLARLQAAYILISLPPPIGNIADSLQTKKREGYIRRRLCQTPRSKRKQVYCWKQQDSLPRTKLERLAKDPGTEEKECTWCKE